MTMFTPELSKMLLRLRRLHDEDPELFGLALRLGFRDGSALGPPPALVRGKPLRDNELSLALLLGDYRHRPAGMTREQWLEDRAGHGLLSGTAYAVRVDRTADTILTRLKKAEHRAKVDPEFSEQADFWGEALRALDIG
jgi:hypothetical protein